MSSMETPVIKGIEVKLKVRPEIIVDNLERIGIVNRKDKKIYPSCYLINNDNSYFICHFKDLLKVAGADDNDHIRRNTIAWLFSKWGLIDLIDPIDAEAIQKKKLFVLTKEQKDNEKWEIVHKYHGKIN